METATQQRDVTVIETKVNRYGDGLESGDIVVTGARWGKCSIGIVPEGREGRQEQDGAMIAGPWGYTVTHAAVIDNTGQAKREYDAAQRVELGETVRVQGLPGLYTFEARDQRKFEGDGVKLVAADAAARANEARCKAAGRVADLAAKVGNEHVTSAKWLADCAIDAVEKYEQALLQVAAVQRAKLDALLVEAVEAGKI